MEEPTGMVAEPPKPKKKDIKFYLPSDIIAELNDVADVGLTTRNAVMVAILRDWQARKKRAKAKSDKDFGEQIT